MSDWNYNQYQSGGPWEGNRNNARRSHPEMHYYNQQSNINPQQYVGFQDFLNQYQTGYQNYPINYHNQQHNPAHQYPVVQNTDLASYRYNSSPSYNCSIPARTESAQPKMSYRNAHSFASNSRVSFDAPGQSRGARDTRSAQNDGESRHSNRLVDNQTAHHKNKSAGKPTILHEKNSESEPGSNYVASKSKLTATAEEFVPQGSRPEPIVEEEKKSTPEPVLNENTNCEMRKSLNRKSEYKLNPRYCLDTYRQKPASGSNDQNKNNSWRRGEEDEDDDYNPTESVVFESQHADRRAPNNDSNHSYGNRGDSSGSRYRKDGAYQNSRPKYNDIDSNSGYNDRSFKNIRSQNQNFNRHNSEMDGSKYSQRQKSSYNSNESFRQRNFERDREPRRNDNYYNKENDYDDSPRGAVRKIRGPVPNQQYKKYDMPMVVNKDIDGVEVSQRERLTEQLRKGILECLVCCERIKQTSSVWSCGNCFHVLHLDCIIKWAKSSLSEGRWRCPACQNNNSTVPNKYKCFCGKQENPDWYRGGDSAHTCGNVCGRLPPSCVRHPCTLLCHAGPCPQCDAVVVKKCECGATSQSMRCSHAQPLLCGNTCNKPLNCQVHHCEEKCHAGSCQPCSSKVDQQCHCEKGVKRTLFCDSDSVGMSDFSCGDICNKKLECQNHNCTKICHKPPCDSCELLPENVKKCPCGQTLLKPEQVRNSCLDAIPVCDEICSKTFNCGPPDNKHKCKKPCHHGDCPPCPDKTVVSCRCGQINSDIACINLEKERDNVRCRKKCPKKQSCGKHRCKTLCCIDTEHRCQLPCNRMLSCGLHRCEDTCHSGHCDPCWRTSFDELRCSCGETVRFPPIPCGTRPPLCTKLCTVPRPCGHPVLHNCHPQPPSCPPCTVLTQRFCHGRHKMRKAIPCHQEEFSCGLQCGKELSCTKHKCIETCHKGNCPTVCTQLCETVRLTCGHMCGGSCKHADPCPIAVPCKKPVNVSCLCGRRTATRTCSDHMRDLQRIQTSTGMLEGAMGKPIDIKALIAKGNTTTTLDCDDECYVEERNRRMAIGLQIRNPDVSSKLMPRYSDSMKNFAARDESFCVKIHEKLTELVLLAQKSVQRTRSHSFQPMNHLKRQFIHEYCEHFGCESKAYDTEPYRNIVATAFREKSWLPALSLMEAIRRDKGQRRVPGPIVGSSGGSSNSIESQQKGSASGVSAWATLSTNYGSSSSSSTNLAAAVEAPRKPKIDYFDAPPED